MESILPIIAGGVGLIAGGGFAYFFARPKSKIIEEAARREAERILKSSELDAERVRGDGRKHVDSMRENAKREEVQMRERLEKQQTASDERIMKREESLEEKSQKMDDARAEYEKLMKGLEHKKEDINKQYEKQVDELSKISDLSKDDAKKEVLDRIEKMCSAEFAETMRKKLEDMREHADEEASNIIVQAIQRYAAPTTAESTITVVKLEDDSMKGKIIGREGRNINAFEMLTGVDLIIDDTPGTITISSFDMFRRYVAKVALEELLKDGRIHPSRIEESVKKAESEADKLILEIGQKACQDVGVTGFPEPILKLIGRLRFRTSYGQNVLQHSIEMAYISEAIAQELPGADPEVCKKACLVHDIGKAVSHEVEGGHAIIGIEILKKFDVDEKIITAMQSHHEDFPYESIESRILQATDAISASRPGARRETLEKYIKRLKQLEAIAGSFPGVEKVFAIQAGREVRVFVNAEELDDLAAQKLSFEIARKIEKECDYPGEVKVALIRETRYESLAK